MLLNRLTGRVSHSNAKLVSLKPLIEHFYLEDKRQAILQLASLENVTVSYQVANRKRSRRPPKPPESRGLHVMCNSTREEGNWC